MELGAGAGELDERARQKLDKKLKKKKADMDLNDETMTTDQGVEEGDKRKKKKKKRQHHDQDDQEIIQKLDDNYNYNYNYNDGTTTEVDDQVVKKKKKKSKKGQDNDGESIIESSSSSVVNLNGNADQLLDDFMKNKKKKRKKGSAGRDYTVSLAVASSILKITQSPPLRSYLAGQIARACSIFSIDEIIVFDDSGGHEPQLNYELSRILEYLECPQYLRKDLYPLSRDFQYIGVISPLAAPHHLKTSDILPFREGIVTEEVSNNKSSYVNVGLKRNVLVDKKLMSGLRVTVKFDNPDPVHVSQGKKMLTGQIVSPNCPTKELGLYWGYVVRCAPDLGSVFSQCPWEEGYDLTIGTSDKGRPISSLGPQSPNFKHLLLTFGGVNGLEYALENDESLKETDPESLFHHYLNTCPSQGCRTIRTEEAILISLSALSPFISSRSSS